jgi:hypothetical protein
VPNAFEILESRLAYWSTTKGSSFDAVLAVPLLVHVLLTTLTVAVPGSATSAAVASNARICEL